MSTRTPPVALENPMPSDGLIQIFLPNSLASRVRSAS
jgi:hypothetical protein